MSWYSDENSGGQSGSKSEKSVNRGTISASKKISRAKTEPNKLRVVLASVARFIAYLILFVGLVGVLAVITFAILKLFPQTPPAEQTAENTINVGFETWLFINTGQVMYSPVLRALLGAVAAVLAGAIIVGFYYLASRYSQKFVRWIVRETSWKTWAVEIGLLVLAWILVAVGAWALAPDFASTVLVVAIFLTVVGVACFGAMRLLVGNYFDNKNR